MWPHTVQCAREASINCSQMWTPSYTPRVPPWYVSRISLGQLAQYLGGQQPRRYQGWRKLQISSILAQNFWVVDCGCRWVGWRCYWAATRLGEKEKCRRSTFQSTSTYRSLPVCLSGSEQPARRIFLVIRKDIYFRYSSFRMGSVGTNVEALEVRIKELELENMSLKSQLDKYQTIFALQGETVGKQVTLTKMTMIRISFKLISYFLLNDWIFSGCLIRNANEEQEGGSRDGHICWAAIPQKPPGAILFFFSTCIHFVFIIVFLFLTFYSLCILLCQW